MNLEIEDIASRIFAMPEGEYGLTELARELGLTHADLAERGVRTRLCLRLSRLNGYVCNGRYFCTRRTKAALKFIITSVRERTAPLAELRLTISGGPAAGKTLLMRRLAALLSAEGNEVLMIDAGAPVGGAPLFAEAISNRFRTPRFITIATKDQ